jgi:hypothetical protein
MIPISSEADYKRTREYAERLQDVLVGMRQTHTASQYEWMSRSFLKELTQAQHEIARFLAVPPSEEASDARDDQHSLPAESDAHDDAP